MTMAEATSGESQGKVRVMKVSQVGSKVISRIATNLLGSPGGLALARNGHAQRSLDGLLKLGVAALHIGDYPNHELVRVLRHL